MFINEVEKEELYMKRFKTSQIYFALVMLILSVLLITGCGGSGSDALLLLEAESGSKAPGTCTKAGPAVIASSPTDGAMNVSTSTFGHAGKLITANFSEAMKVITITDPLTFTIKEKGGTPVDGTVTMVSPFKTATFTTDAALDINTEYVATITTAAMSALDTSLPCSYRWHFTTGTLAGGPIGQPPVFLGTASPYGVFACAASVTLVVDSLVNGNVGLNPAGACNNCVVGTTVKHGVIHNGGAKAVKAQEDFNAAYNEASVRATGACSLSSPSDIHAAQAVCVGFTPGPTYRPGLYRTADPIGFTGTITLDAQNDPEAVFIFQTDSALTTAPSSVVVLANQAQAKNVFWIVGSAATLGVSSTFKGTVIANSAGITVNNGVSPTPLTDVEGRLFAGAAITVDHDATVSVPLP
jgi:hypothetical protein